MQGSPCKGHPSNQHQVSIAIHCLLFPQTIPRMPVPQDAHIVHLKATPLPGCPKCVAFSSRGCPENFLFSASEAVVSDFVRADSVPPLCLGYAGRVEKGRCTAPRDICGPPPRGRRRRAHDRHPSRRRNLQGSAGKGRLPAISPCICEWRRRRRPREPSPARWVRTKGYLRDAQPGFRFVLLCCLF